MVNNLNQGNIICYFYSQFGIGLNERELEFLKLACSDLTYAEIADKMCVSPRRWLQKRFFCKAKRKSMVIEAIRLRLIKV